MQDGHTRPKLRFATCPAYQNMTFPRISYTYLAGKGEGGILCKQMKCTENLPTDFLHVRNPNFRLTCVHSTR